MAAKTGRWVSSWPEFYYKVSDGILKQTFKKKKATVRKKVHLTIITQVFKAKTF
jgi:hypothetical protein